MRSHNILGKLSKLNGNLRGLAHSRTFLFYSILLYSFLLYSLQFQLGDLPQHTLTLTHRHASIARMLIDKVGIEPN